MSKDDLEAISPRLNSIIQRASRYPKFRKAVIADPDSIISQFKLDQEEEKLLKEFTTKFGSNVAKFEGPPYSTEKLMAFVKMVGGTSMEHYRGPDPGRTPR